MALLGWTFGISCIALSALITFYSYNLLSVVLEHHALLGTRLLRFRDLSAHILGPGWGKFFVGPLQFAICYGAVISSTLLGGQILKFIYLLYNSNGEMQLYQCIIIFGGAILILAQMPSFHSLRHINFVSLILCLAYTACITAGSIHIGNSKNSPPKDHSVNGSKGNRLFSSINAISIISTTYACGIIPEIQATIAPPLKGKMLRGLCICYMVIVITYFTVGISGYWAFGNAAEATILANFMSHGTPLLPSSFLLSTNIFILLQLLAIAVIYLQPTNELFEKWFADPKMNQFSVRNIMPRLIFRSMLVIMSTLIAAMFPFFGDIMAVFGAFGCIPLDFILPMVLYNVTFRPSKQSLSFWLNTLIAIVSSILVVVGAVASVRQVVIDATTYSLFANM